MSIPDYLQTYDNEERWESTVPRVTNQRDAKAAWASIVTDFLDLPSEGTPEVPELRSVTIGEAARTVEDPSDGDDFLAREPEAPWWVVAGLDLDDVAALAHEDAEGNGSREGLTVPTGPSQRRSTFGLLTREAIVQMYQRQGDGSVAAGVKNLREAKAEEPAAEMLVEGLIVRSAVTVVAAGSEAGKTSLCYHLSLAVARADKTFIGLPMNCRSLRVLWISVEGGWRQELKQRDAITPTALEARIDAIGHDPQTGIDSAVNLAYRKGRELDLFIEWTLLGQHFGPDAYDLVVVDHLTGFCTSFSGESQNGPESIAPFLGALSSFASQTGAAVLLLHHHNKTGGYSGSFFTKAGSRALINLDRSKTGTVTLEASSNYFAPVKLSIDKVLPLELGAVTRITADSSSVPTNEDDAGTAVKRRRGRPKKHDATPATPPPAGKQVRLTVEARDDATRKGLDSFAGDRTNVRAMAQHLHDTGIAGSDKTLRTSIARVIDNDRGGPDSAPQPAG